jgi:hypothetical protein
MPKAEWNGVVVAEAPADKGMFIFHQSMLKKSTFLPQATHLSALGKVGTFRSSPYIAKKFLKRHAFKVTATTITWW